MAISIAFLVARFAHVALRGFVGCMVPCGPVLPRGLSGHGRKQKHLHSLAAADRPLLPLEVADRPLLPLAASDRPLLPLPAQTRPSSPLQLSRP